MALEWLTAELRDRPFTVSRAREAGVPAWRLRDASLYLPTKSVRSATPVEDVIARARAFRAALPEDVTFSHVTASQLWGLTLPDAVTGQGELDVMRQTARNRIRRSGCCGHRGLESRMTAIRHGLPLTGLADTWVDLGEVLDRGVSRDDLVVVGDEVATRLAGRPEPGSDRPDWSSGPALLRQALSRRVRPRGGAMLESALGVVRAPVRSPMETRARLMFVRAGFPEPRVNRDVHGRDGQWLLEGDLVWEEQRVVGEYQGRDHASIRQRSYDADRRAVAGDEEWTVIEIFAADIYQSVRRISCLRRFARALELDPAGLHLA
jgi:hypothetical protein